MQLSYYFVNLSIPICLPKNTEFFKMTNCDLISVLLLHDSIAYHWYLQNSNSNRQNIINIMYCEIFYLSDKCNMPWKYRYFCSSVNLMYSYFIFSFSTISMNNSEEAIFCLAVNKKFTCSWLNFPSYWRGTKVDNPKITYVCVWNTFWHFFWNKYGQCSRHSQYFM